MSWLEYFNSLMKHELTVLLNEVEEWQHDNPSIHSGYRIASNSYSKSAASLLYIHNESVNVYTHLLGAIGFIVTSFCFFSKLKQSYKTVSNEDFLVFTCFFFGAVFCQGCSSIFHLICNHSHEVSRWANQLDYLGIVLLIWGSIIPSIYYGFKNRVDLIRFYWLMITLIGIATAYTTISKSFRTPEWRSFRAALFVAMGLSSSIPVLHGVLIFGYSNLRRSMGVNWVLLQGFLYIFGASLYAARIPEKFWPGNFDILFSSHQIMHVLVVAAASSHLNGLLKAFNTKHKGEYANVKVFGGKNMKTE